eukprot:8950343-Pyramimonas_sp.AAC.1
MAVMVWMLWRLWCGCYGGYGVDVRGYSSVVGLCVHLVFALGDRPRSDHLLAPDSIFFPSLPFCDWCLLYGYIYILSPLLIGACYGCNL